MTPSPDRTWWAFTGVGLISFLGCIDLTIVNTAAPRIQAELGASMAELQLVVNMFIVALSMFMVTMGRLADSFGRRRVLYAGTVLFGLASLGAGASSDTLWLIVFRFLQGAAGAVLYTSTGAIVQHAFPPDRRGRAMGALYGVNGFGLAVGPLLGGLLVSAAGWRWVFLINVPLVVLALALCSFSVRESRDETAAGRLDWPGLLLSSLGIPAVVLAFTLGGVRGWTSPATLGLLAFAVLALAAFALWERRSPQPLLDLGLFRNRSFLGAITSDFALACFYTTVLFLVPLYLSAVRGLSGYAVGALLLPCTAVMAALSPFIGRLIDRFGPRPLLAVGFTALTVSALLQTALRPDTSLVHLSVALAAMGVGWACVLSPATVSALSAVPERQAGLAVGSSWTFHNLGGALGLAASVVLFRAAATDDLTTELAARHQPGGGWLEDAVAEPEHAGALLRDHTTLPPQDLTDLFGHAFTQGTQAAMWLLTGVALAALGVVGLLARSAARTPESAVAKIPAEQGV
ncbi:MFS transporter [Streptomyces sp. NPDC059740]|uniref:MFS transporter n=1 Tax=Streptomyces sp. NPDC059740 TaxID=3346926 RepID=UPI003649A8C7